jgi:hypothetical protein
MPQRRFTPAEQMARDEALEFFRSMSAARDVTVVGRPNVFGFGMDRVQRTYETLHDLEIDLDDPVAHAFVSQATGNAEALETMTAWASTCRAVPASPPTTLRAGSPFTTRDLASGGDAALVPELFDGPFATWLFKGSGDPWIDQAVGSGNVLGTLAGVGEAVTRTGSRAWIARSLSQAEAAIRAGARTARINDYLELVDANFNERARAIRANRPIPPGREKPRLRLKIIRANAQFALIGGLGSLQGGRHPIGMSFGTLQRTLVQNQHEQRMLRTLLGRLSSGSRVAGPVLAFAPSLATDIAGSVAVGPAGATFRWGEFGRRSLRSQSANVAAFAAGAAVPAITVVALKAAGATALAATMSAAVPVIIVGLVAGYLVSVVVSKAWNAYDAQRTR